MAIETAQQFSKIAVISQDEITVLTKRLVNQLWKMIPMRENQEDWKKQLQTIILEITGFNEIFINNYLLSLLGKLEGLSVKEVSFEMYRKTIFECISLVQNWRQCFYD